MNPETVASPTPSDPAGGVQRQVVLPVGKSVEIAWKNLKVRFFRSLITTLSLVLAVSFLSFVNVGTDVANGLLATGDPGVRQALIRGGLDLEPGAVRADTSPKQRWIVILSLLVCVVGIVNAQLMAVTERFREIGTMKCLGALDNFVVRLFLIESSFMGAVGSLLGVAMGFTLSFVRTLFSYRVPVETDGVEKTYWLALRCFPAGQLLLWACVALCIGVVLSVIAAIYPAYRAARMEPVEAMRAEQ